MRFFLILLLTIYLSVVFYKYFIDPFLQGLKGNSDTTTSKKASNKIKVIYNPNDRQSSGNTIGEYVDYEEVKDK